MFFDLVRKNSRRSRRENSLFFASMLASVIAFYMILSLSGQDVMIFLRTMESDAVNRLLQMIPLFFGVTLFLLFFLVYFAGRYQLGRRNHEFGVYLMMGMRRFRLFLLLLAEELWSNFLTLAIGIPAAVLLSELVSLITARIVGLGIIGHQISFSWEAVLGTAAGFLLIKCVAFVILSGKIVRTEISSLLAPAPEAAKKQLPKSVYIAALFAGMALLGTAYAKAIQGFSWASVGNMGITMLLGLSGTFLLFWGLRCFLGMLAGRRGRGASSGLQIFTFRQLQENVMQRPASLAVSSLMILASLCCLGFGIAASWSYGGREGHALDYTFTGTQEYEFDEGDLEDDSRKQDCAAVLEQAGLLDQFDTLFEMKIGHCYAADESPEHRTEGALNLEGLVAAIEQLRNSEDKEGLIRNLSYYDNDMVPHYRSDVHLIALSGYNELLQVAGKAPLELKEGQAVVYMDSDFLSAGMEGVMNQALARNPTVLLAGEEYLLTGAVQTTNPVVDRSITLALAMIVPDDAFGRLTQGRYDVYWNAALAPELLQEQSLLQAIRNTNTLLDATALCYESYLQNIGRQLFYVVAASYITLYLAIIFLVIANTVLGVQFLMQQQTTGRRYRTLARLGSTYEALCASQALQIRWYFGIPTAVAAAGSMFGIRALFTGMLPPGAKSRTFGFFVIALAVIVFLCVVEWGYIRAVRKAGARQLLHVLAPEREE